MKFGRRLTAVGMLTGGLLLVGFAAPSLADVGSADGATGTTSSVTSNAGSSTDTQAAEQAAQPQDAAARSAAVAGPVALDGGNANGFEDCVEGDPTSCADGLYCQLFPDDAVNCSKQDACDPPQHDQEDGIPGCQPQTCQDDPSQSGCPPSDECTDQDPIADGCQTKPCAEDSSQVRSGPDRCTRPWAGSPPGQGCPGTSPADTQGCRSPGRAAVACTGHRRCCRWCCP